ncbi:carbohydrate ABC transporter permease [Paenibacillus sp. GCM10027626]|uniref:carbohydrate ABC transporter permease n=1 Tax=Paenibacillus sp. GCM10027626 TaxID=3273411 RepID=UPI00363607A4
MQWISNRTKRMRALFILSMIIYPVAHYLLFTIYVNINTIVYAFKRWNISSGVIEWVGLHNFQEIIEKMFTEAPYKYAVQNTLLWIPLNIFVLLPLSLYAAYMFSKKIRFHNFYRIVYFFPSILSIVIITMVFSFMVSPNVGVVNAVLDAVGLESLKRSWLGDPSTALGTIFFFCVWAGIGFNAAILLGAIGRIPGDLYEVGELEGITRMKELTKVVVPMIWPTISTLVIIGTSSAFTIFLQSKLLSNGGPNYSTNTVALQIVNLVTDGQYGTASAFGVLLAIIGGVITWIIKSLLDKTTIVEY